MQVTQPNEFYKGLPKEDVFFVKDDQNNPVGEGFLIYQYQPTIFPSRPVNIYFSMTSKPEGEYWLLGSLAARARQLRSCRLWYRRCLCKWLLAVTGSAR